VQITVDQAQKVQQIILGYYAANKRDMPWRATPSPYYVMVSELMLQQTQVTRVIPKFMAFIVRFPDIQNLAQASLADVIAMWNGLGYNRRAKYLWEAAKKVTDDFDGKIPSTTTELISLPGVGPNTAGAIMAYAYNQPVIFIETNIRTVIIHHFFAGSDHKVTDAEIATVLQQIMPITNTREWYWALMDYGAYVKATAGGQLNRVHGYKKQSKFKGSRRQIRGKILTLLIDGAHNNTELAALIADKRLAEVLATLSQEGLIAYKNNYWQLTGQPT